MLLLSSHLQGGDLLAARACPYRAGGSAGKPCCSGLRVGPPVWLPLACREGIAAGPALSLISERCRVRAEPGFFVRTSARRAAAPLPWCSRLP